MQGTERERFPGEQEAWAPGRPPGHQTMRLMLMAASYLRDHTQHGTISRTLIRSCFLPFTEEREEEEVVALS